MKNNNDNLESNMFQNVYVELHDGTIGLFSGPVLITGDPKDLVKSVSFSPPKNIPDNLTWNDLWKTEVV